MYWYTVSQHALVCRFDNTLYYHSRPIVDNTTTRRVLYDIMVVFFFFLGRDNRVVINVERLAANTRGSPRVQMNNSNNKIFCTLWRIYDTIIKKTWRARELQRTTLARARNTRTSRGYLIFICLPNPNARGTSSGTATLVFIRRVRR